MSNGKNPFVLGQNDPFDVENGVSHGSIGNDGEDDEAIVLFLDVTGKLDIGKSGLIFNVFASAFS